MATVDNETHRGAPPLANSPEGLVHPQTHGAPQARSVDEALAACEGLSLLPPEARGLLTASARLRPLERGELAAFEGDAAIPPLLVLDGRLSVLKSSPNGKELIVESVFAGDPFPVLLALDRGPCPFTVRADIDTLSAELHLPDLDAALEASPDVQRELMHEAISRLKRAHEQLRSIAHERVEQRVASSIIELADGTAESELEHAAGSRHDSDPIPVTREQLASMTAATPETVIRITKDMERRGILDLSKSGEIGVINEDMLARLAANREE